MNDKRQNSSSAEGNPWYKEPWAWFVLAPLIVVVFACSITVTIAFKHSDDVVKDSYVKSGKVYDKDFAAETNARALGIKANLSIQAEQVILSLDYNNSLPPQFSQAQLTLHAVHPRFEAKDIEVQFKASGVDRYVGDYSGDLQGRWTFDLVATLEDKALWRLKQEVSLTSDQVTLQ